MATRNEIAELYVATFNRAADAAGLDYWVGVSDAGDSINKIASDMLLSSEAANLYAGLNREDTVIKMYANMFNRTVDGTDTGVQYWTTGEGSAIDSSEMILALINGALGADKTTMTNKATVGVAFADAGLNDVGQAISVMQDVTNISASVTVATDAISASVGEGNTFLLTTGQDILTGTSGNDTFIARGNSSLTNADMIDGGAGTDTLEVMIDNAESAESPLVTNVEILKVQGQNETTDSGSNDDVLLSTIDAGDMESVEQYWSEDSRSDVVIEDVSRNSHITTIGMRETDPNVDYAVYFDPENITKPGQSAEGATLELKLSNVLELAEGNNFLEGFTAIKFSVDGEQVTVELADEFGAPLYTTYAQVDTAIEDQLAAQGITTVSVVTQPDEDVKFSSTITADSGTTYAIGDVAGTLKPILLVNTGSGELTAIGITDGSVNPDGNTVKTMSDELPSAIAALTQTDIILDRVGKNSEGGELIVGNESNGATHDGSDGIQQFNVDVDRDSWLSKLSTTANDLEVVNVENISTNNGTADGSLRINLIQDIRVFDSSAMAGEANITVTLSDAITAKYLDLTDDATDSSADNSELAYNNVVDREFSYDFGSGNDTFNLTLDNSNLEEAGTTNREDFVMVVNGNGGDDKITTIIEDGSGVDGTTWYTNSTLNANMTVNGGAGNDTITTSGAGNMAINAGTGNDTVYADNLSTAKAQFVVNATNTLVADTISDVATMAAATDQLLYKAQLTVTYSGASVAGDTGVIAGAAVAGTTGFESTVTIGTANYIGDRTNINQAIKDAINNDAVLSKLLVAKDGPANTLVITSLVDGQVAATDLDFNIVSTDFTALSASELLGLDTAWEKLNNDSSIAAVAAGDLTTAATNAATLYDTEVVATDGGAAGTATSSTSDNKIDLGTGNDVLVLGSGAESNDTIILNGSIGNNTIVNFEDTNLDTAQDKLDFTSYLNNLVTLPGASTSTESQTAVATTGDNAGVAATTLAANGVATINDFVQTSATVATWAGMTAAHVLAAVQDTNATSYANLVNASVDIAANGDLVGNSQKQIIMIENDLNQGEYKVFEMTSDNTTVEFTAATLLGTIDFGASIDAAQAGVLV